MWLSWISRHAWDEWDWSDTVHLKRVARKQDSDLTSYLDNEKFILFGCGANGYMLKTSAEILRAVKKKWPGRICHWKQGSTEVEYHVTISSSMRIWQLASVIFWGWPRVMKINSCGWAFHFPQNIMSPISCQIRSERPHSGSCLCFSTASCPTRRLLMV